MGWSDIFNTLLVASYMLMLRRIGLRGVAYWVGVIVIGAFVAGGGYFVLAAAKAILGDSALAASINEVLSPAVICLLPFMAISALKWPIERTLRVANAS